MVGAAGTLPSGQWILRGMQGEPWWADLDRRLVRGRAMSPVEWPAEPPLFTYKKVGSVPDIASFLGFGPYIVSGRLRKFIEQHAPGACEFLAVRVSGPGRDGLHADYWCINFLQAWECQPNPDVPEVDPALIPAGERLGIVLAKHWAIDGSVVCVDEFKRACDAGKFVGVRFEKVRLATGPGGLVPYKDPMTGKRRLIERRCVPIDQEFDIDAFLACFPGGSYRSPVPNSSALHDYVTLHSVMRGVDASVLRKLLDAGADPNADAGACNLSPILVTIQPKTPEIIRLLHERGADWSVQNAAGLSALMSVSMSGDIAAVRELLSCGAPATQRDAGGNTALHLLCDYAPLDDGEADDAEEVAKLLVEAGVDPRARNNQGLTALDLLDRALRQRHVNCLESTMRLRDMVARLSDTVTPSLAPASKSRVRIRRLRRGTE
jgi:hypothetical protein